MLISLLIGAVAGALAAIMILKPDAAISPGTLLGLAAAGYSGADFIEGFIARYLPTGTSQRDRRWLPQHQIVGRRRPCLPRGR